MRCIHLNVGKCLFLVVSVFINNLQLTQMADNQMLHLPIKDYVAKNSTTVTISSSAERLKPDVEFSCQATKDDECRNLGAQCLKCDFNESCIYGDKMNAKCQVNNNLAIQCKGEKSFKKSLLCRYCYQTEAWEHTCDLKANCNSIATTRSPYVTNCTVRDDILCLGSRTFNKNVLCNWTGGYQWSTALILSITLGGFGADRFYLGHWQEGIGKLFSFGGLGVWTLIDVILISLHYLGPADGSLYI